MVGARRPAGTLRDEFAGGLLPGLTGPPATKPGSQQDSETANQQGGKASRHLSDKTARQTRRKVTLYLDHPKHFDLIDELLSKLRRVANLPRDQSMLIRALLDQAAPALVDPAKLQALAQACDNTPSNR